MNVGPNIMQAIGNTSLVQLRKVVPPGCAKVFVKLEWHNPTGSLKDRMAQAMANVIVALQVAERLGSTASVVTLMVDSGLKYLSTDVYR